MTCRTRNRVNIINFIRAIEPRLEMDLLEPLREEIKLVQGHGLKGTWLLQYDALIDPAYMDLLQTELNEGQEIGAWFEVVQPLAEKAGLAWRGRYSWDWHSNVGFSVGYTPQEREKLADVFMEEFRTAFREYPKSVGSWFMDAHLLGYMSDRYGITGSCMCKDQWGTDGYTLWGGYYNQAYYPSRLNSFMPAQTADNQIPVPVFRMLGSDPIYQYDLNMLDENSVQEVVTLEPVYSGNGGGGDPRWVRWFFDVNFRSPSLSFGYTQVGQENSFGWKRIKDGLTDQVQLLVEEQKNGTLVVETLAESAAWFREQYSLTPASAMTALSDWKDEGHRSVWYYSRNYRINLFAEHEFCYIRDIHLFDEMYEERYLRQVCETADSQYDTLPVMDGARWSDKETRAGIYPVLVREDGVYEPLRGIPNTLRVNEAAKDVLCLLQYFEGGHSLRFQCAPDTVSIHSNLPDWALSMVRSNRKDEPSIEVDDRSIRYIYNGFAYTLRCIRGTVSVSGRSRNELIISPQEGEIILGR